jgi:hypothetical protein
VKFDFDQRKSIKSAGQNYIPLIRRDNIRAIKAGRSTIHGVNATYFKCELSKPTYMNITPVCIFLPRVSAFERILSLAMKAKKFRKY